VKRASYFSPISVPGTRLNLSSLGMLVCVSFGASVLVESMPASAQAPSPPEGITLPDSQNSIEQTVPTPPSSLPSVPLSPSPLPNLQPPSQPSPESSPDPLSQTEQVSHIELLGSLKIYRHVSLRQPQDQSRELSDEQAGQRTAEEIKEQQAWETIDTLTKQSSCSKVLIDKVIEQLTDLRSADIQPQSNESEPEKISIDAECSNATLDDFIRLRTAITTLYVFNGYITSGAFFRSFDNKTVTIQLVQGVLETGEEGINICFAEKASSTSAEESPPNAAEENSPNNVEGESPPNSEGTHGGEPSYVCRDGRTLGKLGTDYVRSRLQIAASSPLREENLRRSLQLLQIDPLINWVEADLTAGRGPGLSILQVIVRENPAASVALGVDNYQSPSINSNQGTLNASYSNILGLGDRLNAAYARTDGLNLYDVNYSIPFNARDGLLTFRYSNSDSRIVTEPFSDLGIKSESETFAVSVRQPLFRSVQEELALGLGLDVRRSQTFLEGRPFSFSEGVDNGEAKAAVVRFTQDWLNRNRTGVIAARSVFSFGIDAFGATANDSGTDGQFFAWLGQFQYLQQLNPANPDGTSPRNAFRPILVTKLNSQLTPDSLLSLERFSLGGVETVRGYTQNQVVTDNGVSGSIELRIPLTRDSNQLQIIPFIDAGYGWNNRVADPKNNFIAGLGLGLKWRVTPNLELQLDYGIPLFEVENQGNSFQEQGIYLSLRSNFPGQ
jgi:hemolysin activation/secretion protein